MNENNTPDLEMMQATVAAQTENIGVLATSIEQLSEALDQRPTKGEARRFSLLVNFVTLVVVGIMILVGINQTDANRESIQDSNRVLNKIEDCLNPDGKCYVEGQERTNNAVNTIVCRTEYAIQRGYETAGLPPFELSPECR